MYLLLKKNGDFPASHLSFRGGVCIFGFQSTEAKVAMQGRDLYLSSTDSYTWFRGTLHLLKLLEVAQKIGGI